MKPGQVREQVYEAAEEALAARGYACGIDVLSGARILHPRHIEYWRRGTVNSLEEIMQGPLDAAWKSNASCSPAAPRGTASAWR